MATRDVRARRVTGQQLDLLWEFLNSNRDIAVAFNRSLQAKEHAKRKWQEITNILNSQGEGAHKDWKNWSKYWVDYKAKLKKKVAALRCSHRGTGGGPSTEPPLTDIEKKSLLILGDDYGQGLPGVQVEPSEEQPSGSNADVIEDSRYIQLNNSTPVTPVQLQDIVIPIQDEIQLADAEVTIAQFAHQTPIQSPQPTTAAAAAPAAAVERSPRRRRRRREPPMSREAARRALVQSSLEKADAASRSARALEMIGQNMTETNNILQRIERIINAAFARAAE